jgi:uncharacterized SAM-binding protein YcdF (DUF218 family)
MSAARILLAIGGLGVASLLTLTVDFIRRMSPVAAEMPVAQAVVFTGQFDRIQRGLALLDTGQVGRLLVSGVNPGAGLTPERFVSRFAPEAPGLRQALEAGQLNLGDEATNTFGNARETACWYRGEEMTGPLLLITSRAHMPRASLTLGARLPGVEIRRAPVDTAAGWRVWQHEFPRYVATRLLVLLAPRQREVGC